jgi:type I restriction enzyme S subunit
VIRAGDLLFAWSGSVGVYKWDGPEAALNQHIFRVTAREGVDQTFLRYLLEGQLPTFQRVVDDQATTMGHVKVADLKRLQVNLPPLTEQRAIAHVLGSLDERIELNRHMSQTLEEICRALFKFWFVDFGPVRAKMEGRWKKGESLPGMPAELWDFWPTEFEESEIGEIPKGWEVKPVSSAVEVNPERELTKGEVAPYVEMRHLPTTSARVAGWVNRPFSSGSRFENGDVLVARITPCLENGKTAYVDFLNGTEVGWGSTEFLVLSAKAPFPPQWIYCLARTEDFRSYLIQNMTGTSGRQRAPAACLDSFAVAVPTDGIAEWFGQVVGPWFDKLKANDEESSTLGAARDALLPKLLSGEIRVKVDS